MGKHTHKNTHPHVHRSHPAIIKRLRRAGGHLAAVVDMIEQQRPCVELAQQLHAVERAVANAKAELIRDHIDHCLDESVRGDGPASRRSLDEFKQITRYL